MEHPRTPSMIVAGAGRRKRSTLPERNKRCMPVEPVIPWSTFVSPIDRTGPCSCRGDPRPARRVPRHPSAPRPHTSRSSHGTSVRVRHPVRSHFRLARRFPALDGLDAVFGSGRTGLVGLNGCGKSTLLKLIAGRLQPARGSVTAHGTVGLPSTGPDARSGRTGRRDPRHLRHPTCAGAHRVRGRHRRRLRQPSVRRGTSRSARCRSCPAGPTTHRRRRRRSGSDGRELSGGETNAARAHAQLLGEPDVLRSTNRPTTSTAPAAACSTPRSDSSPAPSCS